MPLVTPHVPMSKALAGNYAIGAFNVNNMELVQAITSACDKLGAPVVLQASVGARSYAGPAYIARLVEAAVASTSIPVVLHLDHGPDFETAKACIDDGFTSVMIDGSHHGFEANIELTRRVVDYAHERGVFVEAELGRLEGVEDEVNVARGEGSYTDPDQAAEFVERSGCDSLAVAIGTSHGAYKFSGEPRLDLERLAEIHSRLPDTPLVLHGSSTVPAEWVAVVNEHGGAIGGGRGVTLELIRAACQHGICKVNVDTDLRLAFTGALRRYLVEHPEVFDPRKYLGVCRDAVEGLVSERLQAYGCVGAARAGG